MGVNREPSVQATHRGLQAQYLSRKTQEPKLNVSTPLNVSTTHIPSVGIAAVFRSKVRVGCPERKPGEATV
jgi:hypothetical protein